MPTIPSSTEPFPDPTVREAVQRLEQALWRMDLAVAVDLLWTLNIRLPFVRWHPDSRDLPPGPLPTLWQWWNQRRGEAELPDIAVLAQLPPDLAAHVTTVRMLDKDGWQFRYEHYGSALHGPAGTDHSGRKIAELIRISNVGMLFLAAFRVVTRRRLPLYTVHFDCPRLQTLFWHRLLLPLADATGDIGGFLVGIHPLAEHPNVVDREAPFLRDENRYLRSLLSDSPLGVGIFAGDLAFLFANPVLATILKTTVESLKTRQLVDFYVDEADFLEQVMAIRRGQIVRNRETRWRASDGTQIWVALTYERIHFTGLNAVLIWAYDITGRKQLEQELLAMAHTDGLTGVHNRRHFLELAEQERLRSQRYGPPGAVLMLDVDHFKQINDHHGHATGDRALKWLADCLRDQLRAVDLLGRMGGEEFALLLPSTGLEQAREAAERLRTALRAGPPAHPQAPPGFTVSIGITVFQPGDRSMEAPLSRADRALYRAKAEGRDRVVVHPEEPSDTTRDIHQAD